LAKVKHQSETGVTLRAIYDRLFSHYGRQHWWPGDSPFEIIVGAILTQQTTWVNAHRAINRLKEAGALSAAALRRLSTDALAELIYSSGYHHAKAAKLKAMATFLAEACNDDLSRLFNTELPRLRTQFLSVHGIGEETADSILLYAAFKRPTPFSSTLRLCPSSLSTLIPAASWTVWGLNPNEIFTPPTSRFS